MQQSHNFTEEEVNKITSFISLLMQIDQRLKKENKKSIIPSSLTIQHKETTYET